MSGQPVDYPPPVPVEEVAARLWWGTLLDRVCRYFVAVVFLMAAVTKITALHDFTDHVVLHSGLAAPAAFVMAAVLPWLELTCGFCLLSGLAKREAAAIVAILLFVFTAHLFIQPAETDCGCLIVVFRPPLTQQTTWLIVRNLLLLACALRVAWTSNNRSRESWRFAVGRRQNIDQTNDANQPSTQITVIGSIDTQKRIDGA